MSIQKKSLISTLQTAKKANVAADNKGEKQVSPQKIASFAKVHLKGIAKSSTRVVLNKKIV
jgi:hypothetical protein